MNITAKNRTTEFDILRGIAVFLMICAHTIHFSFNSSALNAFSWQRSLESIGNFLCFTIFLFVSGSVSYSAYLSEEGMEWSRKWTILKRAFLMLVGYYFLAFSSILLSSADTSLLSNPTRILKVLLFYEVPGFTEFLLPIIFFSISVIIFGKLYRAVSKSLALTFIMSALLFFIGTALYFAQIPVSNVLLPYKALFIGDFGLYRFPIIQYAPVFLIGINFGFILLHKPKRNVEQISFGVGSLLLIAGLIGALVGTQFIDVLFSPVYRWPPSISFLLIGLGLVFLLFTLFRYLQKVKILDPLLRFLTYIGQDAFDMLVGSTFILFLYHRIVNFTTNNSLISIGLIILTTLFALLYGSINSIGSASLFRKGTDIFRKDQKLFRLRYFVLAAVLIITVVVQFRIPPGTDVAGNQSDPSALSAIPLLPQNALIEWWDNKYARYEQIEIKNTHPISSIQKDATLSVSTELVIPEMLQSIDGIKECVKVIYLEENETYIELPTSYVRSADGTEDKLLFSTVHKIAPQGKDNRYFIYIDSSFASEYTVLGTQDSVYDPEFYEISVVNEGVNTTTSRINRNWFLSKGYLNKESPQINVSINDENYYNSVVTYKISAFPKAWVKTGQLSQVDPSHYSAILSLPEIGKGEYTVEVTLTNDYGKVASGQSLKFTISDPVIILWTIDYEGYDEQDSNLNKLTEISAKYSIPLTHFINPRIFIAPEISSERKAFLSNWLKGRNEPVNLHLHMQKEIVSGAGVTFRDTPRWSKFKDADGYDIPIMTYTYDEQRKIISYGKTLLNENGFNDQQAFRAGGWFASVDTLKAEQDEGFKIDASGRKPELWWKQYSSVWNLGTTTQPYRISSKDQNSSSPPTMSLVEFPNNGGDSTAYDSASLFAKFKENYSGGIAETPTILTYISHPKWGDIDFLAMEKVFAQIDEYHYDDDKGPVIFITMNEAYELWKFYNE